jgi:hypothetical protein
VICNGPKYIAVSVSWLASPADAIRVDHGGSYQRTERRRSLWKPLRDRHLGATCSALLRSDIASIECGNYCGNSRRVWVPVPEPTPMVIIGGSDGAGRKSGHADD